jgi:hypothetical protein
MEFSSDGVCPQMRLDGPTLHGHRHRRPVARTGAPECDPEGAGRTGSEVNKRRKPWSAHNPRLG